MKLYRIGSSGAAVFDIQTRLEAIGYGVAGDPTGEFSDGTDAAVRKFQLDKGLDGDGIVGPNTWRALTNAGHALGDRMLYHRRPMIRGDDVLELQQSLNALGFDAGKADGIFGPDTLRALLDFQRNRHMAEDGICGTVVANELALVKRATAKTGRDQVAERRWLHDLPDSVAGMRIMLDPASRDDEEASGAWEAVTAAASVLRDKGALVMISRSEDTRPAPDARAARINRSGIDIVLSFGRTEANGCFYFATERSESEAGRTIATEIGSALGFATEGKAYPILRETRPPAVVINAQRLDGAIGVAAAAGLLSLVAQSPNMRR